jgi:hypothetical protein
MARSFQWVVIQVKFRGSSCFHSRCPIQPFIFLAIPCKENDVMEIANGVPFQPFDKLSLPVNATFLKAVFNLASGEEHNTEMY